MARNSETALSTVGSKAPKLPRPNVLGLHGSSSDLNDFGAELSWMKTPKSPCEPNVQIILAEFLDRTATGGGPVTELILEAYEDENLLRHATDDLSRPLRIALSTLPGGLCLSFHKP